MCQELGLCGAGDFDPDDWKEGAVIEVEGKAAEVLQSHGLLADPEEPVVKSTKKSAQPAATTTPTPANFGENPHGAK